MFLSMRSVTLPSTSMSRVVSFTSFTVPYIPPAVIILSPFLSPSRNLAISLRRFDSTPHEKVEYGYHEQHHDPETAHSGLFDDSRLKQINHSNINLMCFVYRFRSRRSVRRVDFVAYKYTQ